MSNVPTHIKPLVDLIFRMVRAYLEQEYRPDLSRGTGSIPGGSGGGLTGEAIEDLMSTFLVAGSGITLTYDDAGNILTIAATESTSHIVYSASGSPVVSASGDTVTV